VPDSGGRPCGATVTISRRFLLLGGTAAAALAGCAAPPPSKFRNYQGPEVTGLVAYKARRRLYLMHGSVALKGYDIQLGGQPVGHKLMQGDGKTPEGAYFITYHNPNSAYHLSIGISYPDTEDVARAEVLGVDPGGDIMIHGTPEVKKNARDWTAGCMAVSDRDIEDIYAMVRDGTPILIYP
jgi:murein L,D-transpeptidase YafK